jgi:hypothetical protein
MKATLPASLGIDLSSAIANLKTAGGGSPCDSRVHWVRPELVAEVKFLAWTEDNLLRQVVYEGLREDKPPKDVRLPIPHPQPARWILARHPSAAQRFALIRGGHQESPRVPNPAGCGGSAV